MAKKIKKSSGLTTREKMIRRKEELAKKGNNSPIIFIKEGTIRLRVKSPGEDKELGLELITFFPSKETGSIISPETFGEPCPFMEKYRKLKESSSESDKKLLEKLIPRKKYVIGGIGYKDTKGKEVDPDTVDKVFQITSGLYQDLIDLYLDEDDYGDMTDDRRGYDIKITRTGSGKMDTTYTLTPCPDKKSLPREYRGTIDLDGLIRKQVKTYDELETMLESLIEGVDDDVDLDEAKPTKKDKKGKKVVKKKKRVREI